MAVGVATLGVFVIAPIQAANAAPASCQPVSTRLSYTAGLQTYQVPAGVSDLDMTVAGGSGGSSGSLSGGGGAVLTVRGVPVTPGAALHVVVAGGGYGNGNTEGGGGGSIVYTDPTRSGVLVAAGGGGGASDFQAGIDASTGTRGLAGGGTAAGAGGSSGGGGTGGTSPADAPGGGGGGGLTGDGGVGSNGGGTGGGSVASGAAGGNIGGGYGGGGGGGIIGGGGGGGGYAGGGGGGFVTITGPMDQEQYGAGGGGGGSYSVVTPASTGLNTSGNGYVTISFGALHTVTFDSQGGTAVPASRVECGRDATRPSSDPTRTGYTFDGWFTAASGGTKWDFGTPVTSDITLYAQWAVTAEPVTVNDGNGSKPETSTMPYGTSFQGLTTPAFPYWAGHTPLGWYTQCSGGSRYDFDAPITRPTLICAQWKLDSETVAFDSQGGSTVARQTVPYGTAATKPADPTRSGWVFDGWFTAATGGKAWDFTVKITGPITLHAQWTAVSVDPISVAQGARIAVTGKGFWPGEHVQGALHSSPLSLGTQVADSGGTVSFTATVPARFPIGDHTVVLTGLTSGRSASAPLTVFAAAPPASSSGPSLANTGVDLTPLVDWAIPMLLLGLLTTIAGRRRRRLR